MTTDLAQCAKCAALLNDTDEDIAKHRRWHTQLEDSNEAVRRVASNASKDVITLTATVKDYQRPVVPPASAAPVSIRVTDPDELEPDDTDHIINLDDVPDATIEEPDAGEPAEHPTDTNDDYPLAIDRPNEPTPYMGFGPR